ncbi:hypothetical protein AAMO2058_000324800 [Amorphochlora amoebiformis]
MTFPHHNAASSRVSGNTLAPTRPHAPSDGYLIMGNCVNAPFGVMNHLPVMPERGCNGTNQSPQTPSLPRTLSSTLPRFLLSDDWSDVSSPRASGSSEDRSQTLSLYSTNRSISRYSATQDNKSVRTSSPLFSGEEDPVHNAGKETQATQTRGQPTQPSANSPPVIRPTTRQAQFQQSVHVSHIPPHATWADIAEAFQKIGETSRVFQKPDTTWAHVHFHDSKHVDQALEASSRGQLRVCGQRVKVSRRKKGRQAIKKLNSQIKAHQAHQAQAQAQAQPQPPAPAPEAPTPCITALSHRPRRRHLRRNSFDSNMSVASSTTGSQNTFRASRSPSAYDKRDMSYEMWRQGGTTTGAFPFIHVVDQQASTINFFIVSGVLAQIRIYAN